MKNSHNLILVSILFVFAIVGALMFNPVTEAAGNVTPVLNYTIGNIYFMKYSPYNYAVYYPPGYNDENNTGRVWPVIFFLHGGGDRATIKDLPSLVKVSNNGPLKIVKQGQDFDFIIIAPQTNAGGWSYVPTTFNPTDSFVNSMLSYYKIDRTRVYLTGQSMGGSGSWDYAIKASNKVTAIVPIAGGTQYAATLCNVKNKVAVWAFHNKNDSSVSSYQDRAVLIPGLDKTCGAPYNSTDAKYTQYDVTGHGGWNQTYDGTGMGTENASYDRFNESIYAWMLHYSKQCDVNNASNCTLVVN